MYTSIFHNQIIMTIRLAYNNTILIVTIIIRLIIRITYLAVRPTCAPVQPVAPGFFADRCGLRSPYVACVEKRDHDDDGEDDDDGDDAENYSHDGKEEEAVG